MVWGGGWGAVYKPSICGVGHVFLCLSMYVLVWIFTSFETHFLQICFLLHTLLWREGHNIEHIQTTYRSTFAHSVSSTPLSSFTTVKIHKYAWGLYIYIYIYI